MLEEMGHRQPRRRPVVDIDEADVPVRMAPDQDEGEAVGLELADDRVVDQMEAMMMPSR